MKKYDRDFGVLLKHIHDSFSKSANNQLRKCNTTWSQMGLLFTLEKMPGGKATMKELERKLHVSQPTVVGIVKRLEQKEFVRSEEDQNDRRVKVVYITEEGRKVSHEAQEGMKHDQDILLKGFTEEEIGQFYSLLLRAHDNVVQKQ